MNRRIAYVVIYLTGLCLQALYAEGSDVTVTPTGFTYYQFGQLEKTTDPIGNITGQGDKSWDQHVNIRLGFDAVVRERLRIIAGTELGMATVAKGNGGGNSASTGFSLKEAQGIYTFGDDLKNPPLQIALGYFPFKYNPQATNMGEYLFSYRTGSYPPYIINDFDNCKARLLGLRVSSTLLLPPLISLHGDVLFTSEMTVGAGNGNTPAGDYSLSCVVGCKVKKILDIGAGICLNRLISIDPSQTTPVDDVAHDTSGNPVVKNGDTVRLTMKATKLMARATFDPKQLFQLLFPSTSPTLPALQLSPEDGKLYVETAILGTKNYGVEYDSLYKRKPIMFGFNVPTYPALTYALLPGPLMWERYRKVDWPTALIGGAGLAAGVGSTFLEFAHGDYFQKKLRLDFLSLEMEYFPWEENLTIAQGTTQPNNTQDEYSKQQRFRWSLFAQKTLVKGLCIKALVGKDHFRTVDAGGSVTYEELLRGVGDWHYNVRVMYSF